MDEQPQNLDGTSSTEQPTIFPEGMIQRDAKGRLLKGQKLRTVSKANKETYRQGYATPALRRSATRSQFNRKFIADFAEDWAVAGKSVLVRLRKESPANYVKLAAFLVPRQMEVEHSQGVKGLTDQQLDEAIAVVREMLDRRARALGSSPPLIEAQGVGQSVGREEDPSNDPDGSST